MLPADQDWADDAVAAMWSSDMVRTARRVAAGSFSLAYGRDTPEEARPSFEAAIDEYVTNYLYKAAASDAANPRLICNFLPPAEAHGVLVPGARMGGDNPDNLYRLAGIEHGGRYHISGQFPERRPANASFTLVGNWGTSVTIAGIEDRDIVVDGDGIFTITVDSEPANGRPNHLTSQPHAKFLFVRDTMADWSAETPIPLAIKRLDEPSRPVLSIEDMARSAAFRLVEDVPLTYWFQRMFSGVSLNTVAGPNPSSGMGGLITQANARGWFLLKDDEVGIIRYRQAGAAYAALELTNWWFQSIDAHRRPSSLTQAQAIAGRDGWIECVVSREDPGVANWLDTGGLSTVLLLARWQGLPAGSEHSPPALQAQVMPLMEMHERGIEAGGTVSPAERSHAIDARVRAWQHRFAF